MTEDSQGAVPIEMPSHTDSGVDRVTYSNTWDRSISKSLTCHFCSLPDILCLQCENSPGLVRWKVTKYLKQSPEYVGEARPDQQSCLTNPHLTSENGQILPTAAPCRRPQNHLQIQSWISAHCLEPLGFAAIANCSMPPIHSESISFLSHTSPLCIWIPCSCWVSFPYSLGRGEKNYRNKPCLQAYSHLGDTWKVT